jgi:hypothetical protein
VERGGADQVVVEGVVGGVDVEEARERSGVDHLGGLRGRDLLCVAGRRQADGGVLGHAGDVGTGLDGRHRRERQSDRQAGDVLVDLVDARIRDLADRGRYRVAVRSALDDEALRRDRARGGRDGQGEDEGGPQGGLEETIRHCLHETSSA